MELRLLTAGLIAIATAIAPAAGAADRGCNLKVYVNRSGYMAQAQDYALKVLVNGLDHWDPVRGITCP